MGRRWTLDGWMIKNGITGSYFYSEKPDKDLTSIATAYSRKIQTERMTVIKVGGEQPIAKYITKVTLL